MFPKLVYNGSHPYHHTMTSLPTLCIIVLDTIAKECSIVVNAVQCTEAVSHSYRNLLINSYGLYSSHPWIIAQDAVQIQSYTPPSDKQRGLYLTF